MNRDAVAKKPVRAKRSKMTLADAARVLRAEDKDTLVELLLGWAKADAKLRECIIVYAARRLGPESAVEEARRAFEKAVHVRGYLGYTEARVWARRVHSAIENIAALLHDGHPAAVIELCESALSRLAGALEEVDDSDGHLSVMRDRLEDIHLQACEEARPNPVSLARRLFQQELRGGLDTFSGAADTYAGILGAEGLEEYRKLARAEWEKVPVCTAADRSERAQYFRITHIMELLARCRAIPRKSLPS